MHHSNVWQVAGMKATQIITQAMMMRLLLWPIPVQAKLAYLVVTMADSVPKSAQRK
jgi:hypothetical protein